MAQGVFVVRHAACLCCIFLLEAASRSIAHAVEIAQHVGRRQLGVCRMKGAVRTDGRVRRHEVSRDGDGWRERRMRRV